MLKLKQIVKDYTAGNTRVRALDGIDIAFRRSEFVSILGQSGSGKTTLLNIIGGLDQYTSGDLVINGKSTKEFRDADWDAYRNHSVGFVFQTYNLIPHQSVLSNVELALTISGISRHERRKRAADALARVGLGDQMRKKPNQLSGGQMQRVAIARALASNPDILLADEPTGALDSETSVQIMDILKEIARDRLVIMVTHNPELANAYSTRIIRLLDGKVVGDTAPYAGEDASECPAGRNDAQAKQKKPSMSFGTALSLSLNNLMTKKARTILTCFAGSIGIIGIALILSVSTGFQDYINQVQEDTLSSYPITIEAETVDMSSLVTSLSKQRGEGEAGHPLDAVYESPMMYELMNTVNTTEITKNNLTNFMKFLDENDEMHKYLSAYSYAYDVPINAYVRDKDGNIIKSDMMAMFKEMSGSMQLPQANAQFSGLTGLSDFSLWEEMLPGADGTGVSETLLDQYDVIAGRWPKSYDEVAIIVSRHNELSDMTLYMLGLKTSEDMMRNMLKAQAGQTIDTSAGAHWRYEDILGLTFRLIPSSAHYQRLDNGAYTNLADTETGLEYLYGNQDIGTTLKVTGILRADPDAIVAMMSGAIVYTSALTEHLIQEAERSDIVRAQLAQPDTDVLTGLPFSAGAAMLEDEQTKAAAFRAYAEKLSVSNKAALYAQVAAAPTEEFIDKTIEEQLAKMDRAELENQIIEKYAGEMGLSNPKLIETYIKRMDDDTFYATVRKGMRGVIEKEYEASIQKELSELSEAELAEKFDVLDVSQARLAQWYDEFVPAELSDATLDGNLDLLGYVDRNSPATVSLYATTFENKDHITRIINEYNQSVSEEDAIRYTDYVALLMSSVTAIISAISYVLMAFVAISLIVSSIMIGIITYISVLERTREIGVLRAVGASKRDVSRVFNAETVIVGFSAGMLGIVLSLLLLIPINMVLHWLTGIETLSAILPMGGAAALVLVSVTLTFIAGLIPSRVAARKNPVEALRSE